MTELWSFETFETTGVVDQLDLSGWDVEATDGHLGKIDDATYEVGRSYIVVDTGFWIFGKKRMIPAGSIHRIDPDNETVYVALTKDQVKQAPDYDEMSRDDEYMQRHTDYYGPMSQPTTTATRRRS